MARAFGMPFVHENDLTGTASHYVNQKRNIPAANPEMGGSYLGPDNTALYTSQAIAGLRNIMTHLGMLEGQVKPPRQLDFDQKARHEIRPRNSGYLVSNYEQAGDLANRIAKVEEALKVGDRRTSQAVPRVAAPPPAPPIPSSAA